MLNVTLICDLLRWLLWLGLQLLNILSAAATLFGSLDAAWSHTIGWLFKLVA